VRRKGVLGFGGRGGRPRQHERAKASKASKASTEARGSGAVGSRPRAGNGILAPKMHRHREYAGYEPRDLMGCERSRMGDGFRPPSPAPFAVVTEPAPLRERERVPRPAKLRAGVGPCLLSHQLQLCKILRPTYPPLEDVRRFHAPGARPWVVSPTAWWSDYGQSPILVCRLLNRDWTRPCLGNRPSLP
jgi:hypothetical protein